MVVVGCSRVLQIVFIMASMDDDILPTVCCVIAWDCFRKKRRKRDVWCKEYLLKRKRKKEEVYLANCYKITIKIKLTIVKQSQKIQI
jgi:hypothetical protein